MVGSVRVNRGRTKPATENSAQNRTDPLALPTARGFRLHPPARRPEAPQDPRAAKRWVRTVPKPWAIDLFSGAGGLSLGLRDAGFSLVAAADADALALETHSANLGGLNYCGDLADPAPFIEFLDSRGIRSVDLVAGGPPCQPFSRAGSSKIRSLVAEGVRDASDDRVDLWRSFVRVVDFLQPRVVLLENVPDMVRWADGAVLLEILESLRSSGYMADSQVLQAHRFGVPQHRSRLFVIGHRRGRFTWPRPRSRVTLSDAIGDLPEVSPGHRERVLPYAGPATHFQQRMRKGVSARDRGVVYDHCTRAVRADDAEAFALLGPGETYANLPPRLQRYRSDIFEDKYKRLDWDDLSRSITAHLAKDAYWYIHPDQDRTLSIREAARIQTFPDWFRFAGHPTSQMRQIGNAVPPTLGRAVGLRIKATIRSKSRARPVSFQSDILAWHRQNRREFPWRHTTDPWSILLAELCLRRTRANNVKAIYAELTQLAPSPTALLANEPAVRAAMHPLGLRWRVDNVIQVAKELVERHSGDVPDSEHDLRALTGVGDYVASAVRCFAFGEKTVLLDTNTRRIVERTTGRDATSNWTTRLEIFRLAGQKGPSADFNYALLDLGALVCRATKPKCPICPVRTECRVGSRVRQSVGSTA